MAKSQLIFAKGKAQALDSLFLDSNAPFGYLAVGYSDTDNTGFDDPIEDDSKPSGFQEIDSVTHKYSRVKLESVDDADYTNIDYNPTTQKVTRTYQATLEPGNIENAHINQIAIVSTSQANDNNTDFYSAAKFSSFYKDSNSSITFKISFTL